MRKSSNSPIDLDFLKYKLREKYASLEKAKALNESKNKLQKEADMLGELAGDIERYRNNLYLLRMRATKENDEFRNNRLEYLGSSITDAVSQIFPNKMMEAKVSCDFKRKNTVDLRLFDETGNCFKPKNCNGKLMQYLISFSAVYKISESLGCHNLFIDEAFGVSSEGNLPIIGDLIKSKVDSGMQIILVSQNAALYNDIPRREIKLEYDYDNKCAKLAEIVDVG